MIKLTSNVLKIFAIIFMIIDHIGFYFGRSIPLQAYTVCRILGRAAMPIFCFLIVQGFIYTKSKKKYFFRLLFLAIITQCALLLLKYINITYFSNYSTSIYKSLNIVFSFAISIIILTVAQFKSNKNVNSIKKIDNIIFFILKICIIMLILFIGYIINIDYSIFSLLIILGIYILEKIFKNKELTIIKKILECALIFIICIIDQKIYGIFVFLAFPFIFLYSEKLGNKSQILKYAFYITFPLHHILLYSVAMLICK